MSFWSPARDWDSADQVHARDGPPAAAPGEPASTATGAFGEHPEADYQQADQDAEEEDLEGVVMACVYQASRLGIAYFDPGTAAVRRHVRVCLPLLFAEAQPRPDAVDHTMHRQHAYAQRAPGPPAQD